MKHTCHAKGCTTEVPPKMFMCLKHWRMVPRYLQRLVWKHYQPGQENGEAGVTKEYLRITDEAEKVVWDKENL